MEFRQSEEQTLLVDTVRRFAQNQIAPHAASWDETETFPRATLRGAAELGLGAIYTRADHGGSGMSRLDAALIFEELAAACPSTAAFLSIHNMVCWMIDRFGTSTLCAERLPDLATMQTIASYCLTEPGAGSDAAALQSRAEKRNDRYILRGSKAFISGAGESDLYLVMCRTGAAGPKGISCLLVDKDFPGVTFGQHEKKLGWHSQPTAQVILDDVEVPLQNRLGEEGQGFSIAMAGLDGGRINIAACSLGGARHCLAEAMRYTTERRQFQQRIIDFQATQFRLADMATEWHAARLMVHRGAAALDQAHPEATLYCAMAKRFATDICYRIVDEALQLFGGYGYIREYGIERHLRDLRVHRILEGTNEIMRLIIARRLMANGPDAI